MSVDIRDLFRRKRYAMDERLPNGASPDDLLRVAQSSADVNGGQGGQPLNQTPTPRPTIQPYSQNINPTVAQVQPAPVDQTVATRPRSVMDTVRNAVSQPQQQVAPQQVQQAPTQTLDTGATRDRRTQPRDYIADDEAALRQLQNQKDPKWKEAVRALINAGQAGFGYAPTPILTKRERDIGRLQGQMGQEIKTSEARSRIEQGAMVPFTLPDGTTTYVPAKSVGSLGSRQQLGSQGLSIRRQQMEQHRQRWDQMGRHEAANDAQRLYNSGAADDNEDLRDEIAGRMGLPQGTRLPPHTQGQIRQDEQGNYVLVNPRSGQTTPVTQENAPVGGYNKTLEAGRDRRAAATQEGANQRAGMRGTGTNVRGAAPVKIDGATKRRAAQLVTSIESARKDMETADTSGDSESKDMARKRGEKAATELNALDAGYEAGAGSGGYPYYKKSGQQSAPQAQGPYAGKKFNRAKIAERAKSLGMTPAQAEKQITDGGGIVY